MYLLDTDIATLIYYGRNDRVISRYHDIPLTSNICISKVTSIEILNGRFSSYLKANTSFDLQTADTRLNEVQHWLNSFPIVALYQKIFDYYDKLRKMKSLKNASIADFINASLALSYGATLVTRNTKDFEKIPNLKLENWA